MDRHSYPDREFKIWDYSVSHKQMVIRSLGVGEDSPNLDLHFRGVEFLRAPTIFAGLVLVEPTDEEVIEVRSVLTPRVCAAETVWVLESAGQRHIVVAADLEIAETDYPMMSTALIHPTS